jgi:hypothetical protein
MAEEVDAWMEGESDVGLEHVVLEAQRVYPASRQKGDPNDLLELMGVAGAMRFRGALRTSYLPREWKGQMPGDDFIRERILPRLSTAELARIEPAPASLLHNAHDAVGIGLFHLGRLKPHRVFQGAT